MRVIAELYQYRMLIRALVIRHLAMRYRGSVLGFLWSFLNPLCLMLVYTLVFKFYIRFDQVDNYTIFLFTGLLPWLWTQSAVMEGTSAIVASGHLITKSMFPAHILVMVSVLTTMVHFVLSLPLLIVFMAFASADFHLTLLLLPMLAVIQFVFLYGVALGMAALNVHYRDVQHILGNLLTFLFFLCPILYPTHVVPEQFRITLEANPFALLTIGYHDIVLEGVPPELFTVLVLVGCSVVSVGVGFLLYNRYQESFAELL